MTTHTDWLRHDLAVSGPAGDVAAFRAAARGTGAIPWVLDLDYEEARLLAPMATLGASARILARELRQAIAAHHERVLEHAATHQGAGGGSCPLDLHRLVPVPAAVLRLGPDDPVARRWLAEHWGTPRPLRRVRVTDPGRDGRLRRTARCALEFFAADWTPWQAFARIRRDWPNLILDIRPDYSGVDG